MRINALTIENFKGVSNPVRIEFKPITLLFGPNSAGKSTIVQALHYVREILERGNVDADRILGADESFNLGGFVNFVHNHDRTRVVKFKVEFEVENEALQPFSSLKLGADTNIYDAIGIDGQSLSGLICDINEVFEPSTAWVQLSVAWSYFLNKPYLKQYETGLNGYPVARISCAEDGKRIALSYLNINHPDFEDDSALRPESDDPFFVTLTERIVRPEHLGSGGDLSLMLENQKSVLPHWGTPLTIAQECLLEADPPVEEFAKLEHYHFSNMLTGYLSQVIVRPGEVLLNMLESARYIGPIRKVPSRNYNPIRSEDLSRWSSGLAAWDRLHLGEPEFVNEVGAWLARPDLLNTGYALKLRRYKEIDVESPLYISLTTARFLDEDEDRFGELEGLQERRELVLVDEERLVQVFPQDVGVGISQLLPVVVGALDDEIEILMVEQPELHIHPGLQCRIGDLLINQIQDNNKMFIVETHSEHLLLRLLRRIREKKEGVIPPGLHGLTPEQLSVNYLELTDENGMCIRQLGISEEGDSKGDWPPGFFEERAGELF